MHSRLLAVEITKYGYIDKTGKMVIEPQFPEARDFHEGLAYVSEGWGVKVRYIDQEGEVVFKSPSTDTGDFSEDLATIWGAGSCGYIDKKGKVVIPRNYYQTFKFSEGLARVNIGTYSEGKYGYIDKEGKYVVEPQFDDAEDFSCGLARVIVDEKYGFIDNKGKYVVEPEYTWASDFSEGLAGVMVGDKRGYIDTSGKVAIKPQFDGVYPFTPDGLARVTVDRSYAARDGYINKTGEFVIEAKYGRAFDFSEGLTRVSYAGEDLVINTEGETVFKIDPTKYHITGPFKEDLARIEVYPKFGYIDKTGKIVIKAEYEEVYDFSEGLARVSVTIEEEQ